MNVKQVIVMRKDLKMRRGKEISQGAHAAMAWLTRRLSMIDDSRVDASDLFELALNDAEQAWVKGIFTKITLQVDSEAELDAIAVTARAAGLEVSVIEDAGLTEFGGVKTKTCLAIGPDEAEKIDAVTKHLRLY